LKRSLICSAIVCVLSTPAWAQSSVTIYGALDAGITMISNENGKRTVHAQSGVQNPNPFGFKGVEDLGGGLSAVFRLEAFLNLYTGQWLGGGGFAHNAYVGLQSRSAGTFTMGHQYDFMFLSLAVHRWGPMLPYMSPIDGQAGPFTKLGAPTPFGMFDFDRIIAVQRVPNSLMYQSPNINGLLFGAMYGLGETSTFGQNDTKSFGVDYERGDLSLDAAYTYQKVPKIANGEKGIRTWGVGGRWRVAAEYVDVLYTNTSNTDTGANIKVYEAGVLFPLAPSWNLHAQYQYMKGNAVLDGNAAQQVGGTLDYTLSKRTGVYLSVFHQHASGANANAFLIGMPGPSSNDRQTAVRIAMRTRF
jgi:predicted porin